jgi:hypothetical protein
MSFNNMLKGMLEFIMDGNGFNITDALSEPIDNAIDAKFNKHRKGRLHFLLNREKKHIFCVDAESGMNIKVLQFSTALFDRDGEKVKVFVDDNQQGKYHLGMGAYLLYFSEGKQPTTTLTKENDGDMLEVKLDWPAYMNKTKEYCPEAREMSRTSATIWEQIAIEKSHGTALLTPCTSEKFAELEKGLRTGKILNDLGIAYSHYIKNNLFEISFQLDNEEIIAVEAIDVLGYESAADHLKQTLNIQYHYNPITETYKTYIEKDGKISLYDFTGKTTLLETVIPPDSVLIGNATIQTVVPIDTRHHINSGINCSRYHKIVGKPHKIVKISGDHAARPTYNNACSIFNYGKELDRQTKTEGNKSRHEFLNMEDNLRQTILACHHDFTSKIYKKYSPYSIAKKQKEAKSKADKKTKDKAKKVVEKIIYNSKPCARTFANSVYDVETGLEVGKWDVLTNSVVPNKHNVFGDNDGVKTAMRHWLQSQERETADSVLTKLKEMLTE